MNKIEIEIKEESKFNIKLENYIDFYKSLFYNNYKQAKNSFDEIIKNVENYYESKKEDNDDIFEEEKKTTI